MYKNRHLMLRSAALILYFAGILAGCGTPEAAGGSTAQELQQQAQGSPRQRLPESYFAEDTGPSTELPAPDGQLGTQSLSPVGDASATEWSFRIGAGSGATPIPSGTTVSMLDTYNDRYLKYESRDYGINLGWSSTRPANVQIRRAAGAGNLRYGDVVAIHVNDGGYIKYGSRLWGINLVWSTPAVYEWEIIGGTPGTNVLTNSRVKLLSRVEHHGMVYCWRPVGINLAWQDNCTEVPGYRVLIDYFCSINPLC